MMSSPGVRRASSRTLSALSSASASAMRAGGRGSSEHARREPHWAAPRIRDTHSFVDARTTTLAHARIGERLTVDRVDGERSFRRRLMELGLVPGTPVELVAVAPLGDPIELLVRGCSLSIRRGEALWVSVRRDGGATGCCDERAPAPATPAAAPPCGTCGSR